MRSPIASCGLHRCVSTLGTLGVCLLLMLQTACCCSKKCAPPGAGNHNFTAGDLQGNYVWGAAMNLAWNELGENIVKEQIELTTKDEAALNMLARLNAPAVTKNDIDEASYYVKSGYGQQTVDTINRECRAKFPQKSIPDLNLQLGDKDILSYAYLLKEVQYEVQFRKQELRFDGEWVKGFEADAESYQNVTILSYENEDRFIVSIKLKDNSDQIFLAKGYPMDSPDSLLTLLDKMVPAGKAVDEAGRRMNKKDIFHAPMISLSQERSYEEMLGKSLKNKAFKQYRIAIMKEIIKFDMDEKGAKVENEAFIGMATSAGPNAPQYQPKVMILDKPYWVVMKRASSASPYFLLGINNHQLMKPVR